MGGTFSLLSLMWHASLAVQGVLFCLLLASVGCWWLIFLGFPQIRALERETRAFEREFWSGVELGGLLKRLLAERARLQGVKKIFVMGFQEYSKTRGDAAISSSEQVEVVARAMRAALEEECLELESYASWLAAIASLSPYVGLFGTVWGVMDAFSGIAQSPDTTLAAVAPAISEALVATALGLFAAIPAAAAHTRLLHRLEGLRVHWGSFVTDFVNFLARQGKASIHEKTRTVPY